MKPDLSNRQVGFCFSVNKSNILIEFIDFFDSVKIILKSIVFIDYIEEERLTKFEICVKILVVSLCKLGP